MDDNQLKKYKKYAITRLEKEFKNACRAGDLELLKFFIFSEELTTKVDPFVDNCAGLRWSCGTNKLDVVKFFLESPELEFHAKVNINSDEPFRRAAENGSLEVVRYLLSKKEFIEKIDVREWSDYALRKSFANGHLEMVKYLLFSREMPENCDVNSIRISDTCYGGTMQMRDLKETVRSDKMDLIKFLLTEPRLVNKYQLNDEDITFLIDNFKQYHDIISYMILELEKELKLNPKKHRSPEIQKIIDVLNSKNKLNKELANKEGENIKRIKL